MLTYQKNTLLALLAQFKAKFYDAITADNCVEMSVIDRNITSIEKQIKRL